MEDLLACRVCLATGVNLYDMYKYKLKSIYETICGVHMSPADNYPQYLCSYCSSLLLKCLSFRERSRRSQELMKYAEMKSQILTTSQIHTIAVSNHTTYPFTISPPEIINYIGTPIKIESTPTQQILKKEFIEDSDEEPLSKKVKKKKKRIKDVKFEKGRIIDHQIEKKLTTDNKMKKKITKEVGKENIKVEIEEETNLGLEPLQFDDTSLDACDIGDFDTEIVNNKNEEILDNDETDAEFPLDEIEVVYLTKEQQIQEVLARKNSYNYLNSSYQCEHCYKGFIQDTTYKNHMARHEPSFGKVICDICKTRWSTVRALKAHCVSSHERKYICKLCNEAVAKCSFRAKEHLKWHKGFKFTCKICAADFTKSTSYLTHLRMQHPSKYCCDVCGERFLGEMGLNMHKKKKHRGFEKLTRTEYQCTVCGVKFKCMDALKRHKNLFKNNDCNTGLSSCFQCGENLATQEALKDHLKTHEETVRCEECDKNFAHKRSFSAHYQRVHLGRKQRHYKLKENNIKPYVCEVCGRKCISNATLRYHQRTHTGEKPYQCSECPKKFSIYQRLQIHVRTHTGERPYKCSHCPKAFKQKAALNRHNLVHSGARPYKCAHCGKAFSQSNTMKVHVRTVHLRMPAPYRARRGNKCNDECE